MKKNDRKKRQAILVGLGSLIDMNGQTTRHTVRTLRGAPKRSKALGPLMLETSVLFTSPPSLPRKSPRK